MRETNLGMEGRDVPRAAVSAAIFRGNDVLLVQRGRSPAAGLWSLPGGHIELGETALEAAIRELREETGVEARFHGVADAVDVIRCDTSGHVRFHRVILVFCGIWLGGDPVAGSDAAAAAWHARDVVDRLPSTAGLESVIANAWAKVNSDVFPLKS